MKYLQWHPEEAHPSGIQRYKQQNSSPHGDHLLDRSKSNTENPQNLSVGVGKCGCIPYFSKDDALPSGSLVKMQNPRPHFRPTEPAF